MRFLLLLLFSTTAFGQGTVSSTCIWSGTLAECLPSDGLILKNRRNLRLGELNSNGSNFVSLQAPATLAGDVDLTLPENDGDNLEVLQTNGSGILDWVPLTPMTTRGDMIRGGVSGVPERFSAATDNRVVRGDGTDAVLGQIDDPTFFTDDAAAGVATSGIVTSGTQTFGGVKVFNDNVTFTNGLNSVTGSVSVGSAGTSVVTSLAGLTPGIYFFTISAAASTASYSSAIVIKSTAITYALTVVVSSGNTVTLSGSDILSQRTSGGNATHRWSLLLLTVL